MSQYRTRLPQLDGGLYLTDGGIETTLIFHDGLELPHFAAFHLLKDEAGTAALRRYFDPLRRDRPRQPHRLYPGEPDLAGRAPTGARSSAIHRARWLRPTRGRSS